MHWRKSTWALIAWTAIMAAGVVWSASATASSCTETGGDPADCADYAQVAALAVLSVWFVVALPLLAFWYTRRKTRDVEAPPFDPMDHWPPPPR